MVLPSAVLTTLLVALPVVLAANPSCSSSSQCPEEYPCCNQFGECGSGAHCLGGCHPLFSYQLDACMAMPICKDVNTTFGTQAYPNVEQYLGNPDDTDWIFSGYALNNDDADALLITMPNGTSGTVLSSSRYMLYGRYGSHMKTSRGAGVVSAFISFSNSGDEIDWEFVGYELEVAETNYYYQGNLDWTNSANIAASDTYADYHYYEVDWQEDQIVWYLDGEAKRTLKKSDTYNSTSGVYSYPETPARVQMSLWPVLSTAGEGTIEWAGGSIDWNSDDMVNDGYLYVAIKDAYITCADVPAGVSVQGSKAYVYNSSSVFNQDTIMITDDNTILCSLDNTGLDDNDACAVSSSESSSESSSSAKSSSKSSSSSTKTSSKSSSTTSSESSSEASSTESSSSSEVSSSASASSDSSSALSLSSSASESSVVTSSEASTESSSAAGSSFVQNASTSTAATSTSSIASNGAIQGAASVSVIAVVAMLFL